MKKSFKNICSIIGAVVVISLFVTLIINFIPEKICVSAKIVGENGNVLFEEDNIELLKQKDTVLTLNEAVVEPTVKDSALVVPVSSPTCVEGILSR